MKKQLIAGLTGPTGSGKSTAAAIAAEMNVHVIDCDMLARRAVLPGTTGLSALVAAFSENIILPDGTLDRKSLAAAAFCDSEHTELLNRTLLPHIEALVNEEIKTGGKILLDAPTLFESGIDRICDKTVAVLASREIRNARIIERDKLTPQQAELRISAGKQDDFYKQRADFILYNNGEDSEFRERIRVLFENIYGGLD